MRVNFADFVILLNPARDAAAAMLQHPPPSIKELRATHAEPDQSHPIQSLLLLVPLSFARSRNRDNRLKIMNACADEMLHHKEETDVLTAHYTKHSEVSSALTSMSNEPPPPTSRTPLESTPNSTLPHPALQ